MLQARQESLELRYNVWLGHVYGQAREAIRSQTPKPDQEHRLRFRISEERRIPQFDVKSEEPELMHHHYTLDCQAPDPMEFLPWPSAVADVLAASVQRRRSLADSPHGLGCSPSPPQVTDMRGHATSCQPGAATQRASQEAACRNCRPRTLDRPPFGVSPGLRGEPFASPTQAVNGIFIKRLGHAATRTSAAAEHRNGGQRGRRQILGIRCEPESALIGSAWNAKSRTSIPARNVPGRASIDSLQRHRE